MTDPFATALSDIYAHSLDRDFEDAKEAVYTPLSGDPVSCTVLMYDEDSLEPDGLMARVNGTVKIIEYQKADIDHDAVKGDTFTIGATVYTVQSVRSPMKHGDPEISVVVI